MLLVAIACTVINNWLKFLLLVLLNKNIVGFMFQIYNMGSIEFTFAC